MKWNKISPGSLKLALAVVLVACQPSIPSASDSSQNVAPRNGPTSVTVAVAGETPSLATRLVPGTGPYTAIYGAVLNSPLVYYDRGIPKPLLAAEQPSREKGTWVVNADGTMRTTWNIRSNALWHDGRPVVSDDFLFAFKVYTNPGIPINSRLPESFMDRVEAAGDRAFTIYWKQSYPWADELKGGALQPLPSHLMEAEYNRSDPLTFANHAFWASTDYIGNGPYKLVQWDRGSQYLYRANDAYFMGRPKIDEVIFKVIPAENTLVANVLSGQIDVTMGLTLGLRAGLTIREQWAPGEGEVKFAPTRWNYAEVQHDPSRNRTPGLLDLRVRRAIVHGTNREALAEAGNGGAYSTVADVPLIPDDPLYPELSRTVVKYPFDPRRALTLLEEAGWAKRGNALLNAAGEPFVMETRSLPGSQFTELEMQAMAADLRNLGMQINEQLIPTSRAQDFEWRVTFPGLNVTQLGAAQPGILEAFRTEACASEQRRYAGTNRGCFSNDEYDRFTLSAGTVIDPIERDRAAVAAGRLLVENLGVLGLSYALETISLRSHLVGPTPTQVGGGGGTSNIHEWYWEA